MPIRPGKGVLYLAMDRPEQIRRALSRNATEADRDALKRLHMWRGPLPADVAAELTQLIGMCQADDADTLVVDSLKDAVPNLAEEAGGATWNRARQYLVAAGVQPIELHHNVKRGPNGGPPRSIADVYGSVWLTAGAGSVLALHGDPGDPVVTLRHLKQPCDELGPWEVEHDHTRGVSAVRHKLDLLALAARPNYSLTAAAAAVALFEVDKPTRPQIARAGRKLDQLVAAGSLITREFPGNGGLQTEYMQVVP